jgi:hypothetical protein
MLIMITTYEHLATRQQREDGFPAFRLTDEHVTYVDNHIVGLDRILPVMHQQISKVIRTITVSGDLGMIKMCVADQVNFHFTSSMYVFIQAYSHVQPFKSRTNKIINPTPKAAPIKPDATCQIISLSLLCQPFIMACWTSL